MDYLVDVFLCGGIVALELIGVLVVALLIQGITLWTTGFNIYKTLCSIFFKEVDNGKKKHNPSNKVR